MPSLSNNQAQNLTMSENQPEIRTTFEDRKGVPSIIPSTEGVQYRSHSNSPTGESAQLSNEHFSESLQQKTKPIKNPRVRFPLFTNSKFYRKMRQSWMKMLK